MDSNFQFWFYSIEHKFLDSVISQGYKVLIIDFCCIWRISIKAPFKTKAYTSTRPCFFISSSIWKLFFIFIFECCCVYVCLFWEITENFLEFLGLSKFCLQICIFVVAVMVRESFIFLVVFCLHLLFFILNFSMQHFDAISKVIKWHIWSNWGTTCWQRSLVVGFCSNTQNCNCYFNKNIFDFQKSEN